VGFEPTISAGERPKTYALDRAAKGIGIYIHTYIYIYTHTYIHTHTHTYVRTYMYCQVKSVFFPTQVFNIICTISSYYFSIQY
jgi:hypothetical protein